jgi:excisionase family DNA binding protein
MPHPVNGQPVVDFDGLMTVEEAAPLVAMSAWTLREACRRLEFPHVKLPGRRRILIDRRHVAAFFDGAELETKKLDGGGRIVRPVARGRS